MKTKPLFAIALDTFGLSARVGAGFVKDLNNRRFSGATESFHHLVSRRERNCLLSIAIWTSRAYYAPLTPR